MSGKDSGNVCQQNMPVYLPEVAPPYGNDSGNICQQDMPVDLPEDELSAAGAAKVSVDRVCQVSTLLAAIHLNTRVQVDSDWSGYTDRLGQTCTMLGELSLTSLRPDSETVTDQLAGVGRNTATCTELGEPC